MSFDIEKTAAQITRRSAERMDLFRGLSLPQQSALLLSLSPYVQQSILSALKSYEIVDILDHMDMPSAESLLGRIRDGRRRDRIVYQLKSAIREKVEYFLRFHPKATAALIHYNYLYLPATSTIASAANAIDQYYDETGKFPVVLVHEYGHLVGEVSMSDLVRERNTVQLKRLVRPVHTITYAAEVSEVMQLFSGSKRQKVIVLDHDESVLGIIYANDALDLFGETVDESLFSVSGVEDSERPFDGALNKFNRRYRWLILNLVTCFMAGGVIYLFEDTIDRLVVLAMYIPIVAGMGGNSASQTFAVMLRGITLGSVSLKNCWPAVWREVGAGVLSGVLIGMIVALISVVWNHSAVLGLVVGVTMVGAHVIGGFFGAITPILLKHLGKDPASTSTIFITTVTDVGGLLLLLSLGTLLLM